MKKQTLKIIATAKVNQLLEVINRRPTGNNNIATILQFVKIFEKAYGEKPSVAVIDVFIKNIPRTTKD